MSADKIEAAVTAYANHINRENRERRIQADADRRALAQVDKAVAGIMAAIEDGLYQPVMKARMAELERERQEIAARLTHAGERRVARRRARTVRRAHLPRGSPKRSRTLPRGSTPQATSARSSARSSSIPVRNAARSMPPYTGRSWAFWTL